MKNRVLVVDDDADARKTYADLLASEGYDVDTAGDGEQALDRIDRERPDVILLDVMLPGRDGVEVARLLTQRRDTQTIPIVMITALNAFSVGSGLADVSGIRRFLYKPCPTRVLLEGIGDALRSVD